ncbi:precorrin-4 C11-methyltransferase [Synechococcus sp. PCC 7335]|uniref:precorrin-4 C(11)-methyltransferase n=1 Tax=Synechococcus sp. (strain ATCC 29403 / PCC 7335) TaxID=91464 RepID=UPI00017ED609|nr:precorrin-4 C(11)-methyltransferase [Synechococcus sp. PCC 7335]EDX84426.1 precorrin-4 C11-methyltransferase [Synechococcus sp. PCC 7335]
MDFLTHSTRPVPAVYIVGAGPGDPELLTVKAQKLIARADVLVYANSLVPTQILQTVRADTEKVATAKMTLEAIVPLMIERVRSGKSVVRLHSGDPSLYSAIHEQMLRLSEADIPFEVVPGISAFQAAAAKLQVELTIPAQVQSIILTRTSGRTQVPDTEELAGLAAHRASLCLYLSARHVLAAQTQLMAHYPADTPVAICFRVGWPDEQIKVVPLYQMAAASQADELVRTTLYIISPALAHRAVIKQSALQSVPAEERAELKREAEVRSRLYNPTHDHLFRPSPQTSTRASNQTASEGDQRINQEQEKAKR